MMNLIEEDERLAADGFVPDRGMGLAGMGCGCQEKTGVAGLSGLSGIPGMGGLGSIAWKVTAWDRSGGTPTLWVKEVDKGFLFLPDSDTGRTQQVYWPPSRGPAPQPGDWLPDEYAPGAPKPAATDAGRTATAADLALAQSVGYGMSPTEQAALLSGQAGAPAQAPAPSSGGIFSLFGGVGGAQGGTVTPTSSMAQGVPTGASAPTPTPSPSPSGGSSGGSILDSITGGISSLFGGAQTVTKTVGSDPLLGPLAQFGIAAGMSKLIPGFGAPPKPAPPPPPSGPSLGTVALVGLGVLGVGAGAYVLATSGKSSDKRK